MPYDGNSRPPLGHSVAIKGRATVEMEFCRCYIFVTPTCATVPLIDSPLFTCRKELLLGWIPSLSC